MTQLLAQTLRCHIQTHIIALDIPIFLQEEVSKFLQYIHYYKLKNIEKHLDIFCDYLLYLDKDYTTQLLNYFYKKNDDNHSFIQQDKTIDLDYSYYLSAQGKHIIEYAGFFPILLGEGFDNYNVLTAMLCIKGLFLLTATEFCHANSTRISLHNRLLLSKQA